MEDKRNILLTAGKIMKQNGFEVFLFNGNEEHPDVLRVNLEKKFNLENPLPVEMYFVKGKTPREEKQIFQFYSVLKQDYKPERIDEVKKTIMLINNITPLGQYNVFQENKHIFYRLSILVDLNKDLQTVVMDICDYFSMLTASLRNTSEFLTDVADAYADYEDIKEKLHL